jgi:hypothetical protein
MIALSLLAAAMFAALVALESQHHTAIVVIQMPADGSAPPLPPPIEITSLP